MSFRDERAQGPRGDLHVTDAVARLDGLSDGVDLRLETADDDHVGRNCLRAAQDFRHGGRNHIVAAELVLGHLLLDVERHGKLPGRSLLADLLADSDRDHVLLRDDAPERPRLISRPASQRLDAGPWRAGEQIQHADHRGF